MTTSNTIGGKSTPTLQLTLQQRLQLQLSLLLLRRQLPTTAEPALLESIVWGVSHSPQDSCLDQRDTPRGGLLANLLGGNSQSDSGCS